LWAADKFVLQDSNNAPELEIMKPGSLPSIDLAAGDSATHSTLSRGESVGLLFNTVAGLFSTIAAFVILILIFVSSEYFVVNIVLSICS
jgi:hypothetical protein